MTARRFDEEVDRHRLGARLGRAVAALPEVPAGPVYVVDLDAFDLNAADLVRRAGGKPVRLATKSVRVPALVRRASGHPGFAGVLAYNLREALWLAEQQDLTDVLLGYPSVDRSALARLADDERLAARVTLMVDDVEHLRLVDSVRRADGPLVRVAIDVDAGLRAGPVHLGPRRSPLRTAADVVRLVDEVARRPGFELVGVMTYEGQVAGVPDVTPGNPARSTAVGRMKASSMHDLGRRRAEIAAALADRGRVALWNAGGTGSLEVSSSAPEVTEVSAGSGLLVPHLFDHYRSFAPRPAAWFGLPVVRRPGPGLVTVAGGGLIASGPTGRDRAPLPWAPPGLALTATEGAGEVQTPLHGRGADLLGIGDLVWFRHAKAGEPAEHTAVVHLVSGDRVVESVPTYRGLGLTW